MSIRVLSPFRSVFGGKRIIYLQLRSLSKQASSSTESIIKTTRDPEVEHHSKLSADWWDLNGSIKALHSLNLLRVPLVRDCLISAGNIDPSLYNTTKVLQNQKILEVGCGGGIFSEGLARLHANVTAIDLSDELIKVAKQHLTDFSPELSSRITYKVEPVEVHAMDNLGKYDAVVVSEVIEHIENKAAFLTCCVDALRPGGSIIITTLNKTFIMWLTAIIMAEYVLNFIPRGTHHWDKLISPLDMIRILNALDCNTVLLKGFVYEFWSNKWKWIPFDNFSYAMQAIKTEKA